MNFFHGKRTGDQFESKKQFKFKKQFSQNFLKNNNIINQIVKSIPCCDTICEIGPGAGALTNLLVRRFKKVIAIEIDAECVAILRKKFENYENFEVIQADILNIKCPANYVIGNLPYNIGTKIIEKFLYEPIVCGVFMLQKEVAQRISGADYSRLSVCVGSVYDVTKIVNVRAQDFTPAPKVESQVIRLDRHNRLALDICALSELTKIVFQHPRKKLSWLRKQHSEIALKLEDLGVDLNQRVQDVPKEILYRVLLFVE